MSAKSSSDFDVYMAKLREAKECLPEERTHEQRQLIAFSEDGPSYDSLFGAPEQDKAREK